MCTVQMTCQLLAAESEEAAVVRRLQAGDEEAFRELVETYRTKVYRVVCSIVRGGADADEIAQEVFVKVYFGIGGFHRLSSLSTWIHRIAVNEALGYLRKNRTRPTGIEAAARIADGTAAPDRALAGRELLELLLARLSEEERTLLLLREADGMSIAELSELTGTNESTVKVRLFRTRQKLAHLARRLTASKGARR
jgi:RNA polymerase sigma-70 factor (ECF subfamily)